MKCFYHNDMDGQCAGFWVHLSVGINDNYHGIDDINFIAMDYKDEFPMETIRTDEQVYIVDYSIQPEQMKQLLKITKNVTWIDHHKTAIEKYKDFEYDIRGIRYDGIAGCELAFIYIHKLTDRGSGEVKPFDPAYRDEVPMFTRLIGDRDVWQWQYGDKTKYFYAGMQLHDTSPESNVWIKAMENITQFIEQGKTVEKYKTQQRKYLIDTFSYEAEIEGYKALVCNSNDSSELFGDYINQYDLVIPYIFDGNQYAVSLFSTKIDISEIAKKYGGGGHAKAAGFQCKQLPFTKSR